MNYKAPKSIGNKVLAALEMHFNSKTEGNYTLSDFVNDFDGSQDELEITLIKMAAEVI